MRHTAIQSALAAGIITLFGAAFCAARADAVFPYELSGSPNGFSATLAGTFSYDSTLQKVVAEDIIFDPGSAPGASDEFTTAMLTASNDKSFVALDSSTQQEFDIYFVQDLGLESVDPVQGFSVTASGVFTDGFSGTTLQANPVPAPEPSTAGLLGGTGLLLIGMAQSIKRRTDAYRSRPTNG